MSANRVNGLLQVFRRDAGGLSLIEILVSVAILGLLSLPVMALFTTGLDANAQARAVTKAILYGQAKVEEIRHQPFDNVAGEGLTAVPGDADFKTEVTVSDLEWNVKQVVVFVRWNTKIGTTSLQLTTLVGRR
jgi:prepilin-type N-terminal cleavage/methylation domain-containing protein